MSEGEENYNLKESSEGIGQLYPILVDKKGRIIDGFHRLQANPKWRVQPLDNIDTDEKLLVARCIANWCRREIKETEKAEWVNSLAEIYQKQGLEVRGKEGKNEIVDKLIAVLSIGEATIRSLLQSKFKQIEHEPSHPARILASKTIETNLGKAVLERHREEVKKEIQAEVRKEILEEEKPKIVEQTKKELLESPEFRKEVFKKDIDEMMMKVQERGVEPVLRVDRADESQDVMDEHLKVYQIVSRWGIGQFMILKKFNRLQEALALDDKIIYTLANWKVARNV
jgi:hypothetical protein